MLTKETRAEVIPLKPRSGTGCGVDEHAVKAQDRDGTIAVENGVISHAKPVGNGK
ncbi:MAG: hypothetical protein GX228_01685 [Firmicutes bacterium]|jgi:hypothetical protein|nr:hypothetical protein [Bacillota bacterium]NLL87627.1 hypothetical protein [Bacillota bacterium]HKM18099.1 hypothetical protein [Limnochordia bacterium]